MPKEVDIRTRLLALLLSLSTISLLPATSALALGAMPGAASGTRSVPLASSQAGLTLLDESPTGIRLELSLPSYEISERTLDGQVFSVVTAPGLVASGPTGGPALPAVSARVVVPPGVQVRLSLGSEQTDRVALPAPPMPVPRFRVASAGPSEAPVAVYEPDAAYYAKDAGIPDLCVVASDQLVREWRLVQVRCAPLRYDAGDGSLVVTSHATVSLDFIGAVLGQAPGQNVTDPLQATVAASVLNGGDMARYAQPIAPSSVLRAQAVPPAPGRYRLMADSGPGLYSVTYEELSAAGVPLSGVACRSLRLFEAGQEVAIQVNDHDGDGLFGPGDSLLFYGRERQAGAQPSPYGTTNAYWLDWGGPDGLRLSSRDVSPGAADSALLSATVPLRNYNPLYPDPWRSTWTDLFIYDSVSSPVADDGHFYPAQIQAGLPQDMPAVQWFAVSIPGAARGSATLSLAFQGKEDPTKPAHHHLLFDWSVVVQGSFHVYLPLTSRGLGTASVAAGQKLTYSPLGSFDWDGASPAYHSLSVPVVDGLNIIRISLPGQPDGQGGYLPESTYIGTPMLTYPVASVTTNALVAQGQEGTFTYRLYGFTSQDVIAWDVSDPLAPVQLTGLSVGPASGTWQLTFTDAAGPRTYAIAAANGLKHISAVAPAEPLTLDQPAQYLIVTYPGFTSVAQALAQHRQSHNGLTTLVVSTQAIYDHYSYGLLDPEAIRSFVHDAYAAWQSGGAHTLSYLVLLGDGSYDFKNRLNWGLVNYVPPYLKDDIDPNWAGQAGSDHLFANESKTLPSVLVGRIPVRTASDATAVVRKIITYETTAPGGWSQYGLFAAGDPDTTYATPYYFDKASERAVAAAVATGRISAGSIRRVYQSLEPDAAPPHYYAGGSTGTDVLLNFLRAGNRITTFFGHSSWYGWSSPSLFHVTDVPSLGPTPLTVLLEMTCFTGAFYHPGDPVLDEALLLAPDRGTVSSVSPLSLGNAAGHDMMVEPLLASLLQGNTIGSALYSGEAALDSSFADLIDTYTTIGDPALTPAPGPSGPTYSVMIPVVERASGH